MFFGLAKTKALFMALTSKIIINITNLIINSTLTFLSNNPYLVD